MITITRRLAQQLRTVLRRAFGNFRGTGPAIGFIAGKEGLTVRSSFGDVAVECRLPSDRPADALWLPLQALDDFAGKKDEPVELAATDKDRVTAQWRDGSVPQLVKYDCVEPPDADKFPALPTDFATNPPCLLQALHEATEIADSDTGRFVLSCLQLCPDGSINATDGRQAFSQSGFAFPWSEPLLIPRNKLFHSPELADKPVAVAKSGDWAVLSVEPWTFYLRLNTEGRFPDVPQHIPSPDAAKARCQLSPDDTRFLAETLPKLPCHDEYSLPVTLDLNGHVALRARSADQAQPTEVVLTNSSCTGEPLRININRTYLKRALKLGLQEFCLYGDGAALLAQGDSRKFVWMPLEPGAAIEPADDALRIESPKCETTVSVPQPVTPKKVPPMSEPTTNTTGKASTNGQAKPETTAPKASRRKASQQDLAALIDQAAQFRTALHGLMQEANGLVKALKQHKRKNKAIQTTLDSLKQLKTLCV